MSEPAITTDISALIPQKAPFVLVGNLLLHEEKKIVSSFVIPEDHVLVDHNGYLIESGLIENFAQTIALYQGYEYAQKNLPTPVGYIGSIKNMEIFELPKAGSEIHTTIHILQKMMGVTMVKGEVTLAGKVLAQGEMRTVIVDEFERH